MDEHLIVTVIKQAVTVAAPNARIHQWERPAKFAGRDALWALRARRNSIVLSRALFHCLTIIELYRKSDLLRVSVGKCQAELVQNPTLSWEILRLSLRSRAPDVCRSLARMVLLASPDTVEAFAFSSEGARDDWAEVALTRISAGNSDDMVPMRRLMMLELHDTNPVVMSILAHYLPQFFQALLKGNIEVARAIGSSGWFYVLIGRMLMTGDETHLAKATEVLAWIAGDASSKKKISNPEKILRLVADFTSKDLRAKIVESDLDLIVSVPVWGAHVKIYEDHVHDRLTEALRGLVDASGCRVLVCYFVFETDCENVRRISQNSEISGVSTEIINFNKWTKDILNSNSICVSAFAAGAILAKIADCHYLPFYAEEAVPANLFEKIGLVIENSNPSIFINTGYSFEAEAYLEPSIRLGPDARSKTYNDYLSRRGSSLEISYLNRKSVATPANGCAKYMNFGKFGLMYYLAPNPMFLNKHMVAALPFPYPYPLDSRFADFLLNVGLDPRNIIKPGAMEDLPIAGIEVAGENELDHMISSSGHVVSPVRCFRMGMQANGITEMAALLGTEYALMGDTTDMASSALCVEDAFWKLCMELYRHEISPFTMLKMNVPTIQVALSSTDAVLREKVTLAN